MMNVQKVLTIISFLLLAMTVSAQVSYWDHERNNPYIDLRRAMLEKEAKSKERHLYVKTNAVELAAAIANLAVEVDLGNRMSINLPLSYSAWDYFIPDTQFRILKFQPEFRYWLPEVDGLFVGVHAGVAWLNCALGGDWRYQDHGWDTPVYGGGLGVGYRKAISRNERWFVEFSLGAGVYRMDYDKFRNEPDGEWVGRYKRYYYGIDNVSISLAYRLFKLTKKK